MTYDVVGEAKNMRLFKSKFSQSLSRITITVVAVCIAFVIIERSIHHTMIWYYKKHPELLMQDIPFYNVLKEHDPKLYTRIRQDIEHALENNDSPSTLKVKVRAYLDQVLIDKMPTTSNQAMVTYMQITLEEMRSLKQQGYGLCHQFLYSRNSNMVDVTHYVPENLVKRDLKALTNVIKQSYENPLPPPNEDEVRLNLAQVYSSLKSKYGDDMHFLMKPLDAYADKDQVCQITIALFEEILKLPLQQSGETLRFMVLNNKRL